MITIRGIVATGAGVAPAFTQRDWFRQTLQNSFGFLPASGTLNLNPLEAPDELMRLLNAHAAVLVPPWQADCCAFLLRGRLVAPGGEQAVALLRPLAPGYDPAQVELLAPVHLRTALGLTDGDRVAVTISPEPGPARWIQGAATEAPGAATALPGVTSGQESFSLPLSYGPLPVLAQWVATGQGLSVSLFGGEAHVGAVVMATPRPSLRDPARRSATSSVLSVIGHKDDVLARALAEALAAELGQVVVVTAGVHAGPPGSYDLPPADIERVMGLVPRLAGVIREAGV